MKKIILLAIFLGLLGCTSLTEKGNELYASGMYEEAAEFYGKALARDAANVEARIGLDKARNKIIDRGLIDVRMLRLSSNMAGAAQKLETILHNQMEWNLKLDGAVTSTQTEETRHARQWLLTQLKGLSQSNYPDKFRWLTVSHRELMRPANMQAATTALQDSVDAKGRTRCRVLAKDVSGQRFFLRDFVQKYCAAWGIEVDLNVDAVDMSRFSGLDAEHQLTHWTNYGNAQDGSLEFLLNELKQKFRSSVWYSPAGRSMLSVDAHGNVNYYRNSSAQLREAHYTIDTERMVVSDQGVEEKKKVEVEKKHPYYVNVIQENLAFDIWYSSNVGGEEISKGKKISKSATTESHNEHFPAAGVQPKTPSLMDVTSIFSDSVRELGDEYLDALEKKWAADYCDRAGGYASGENILRCGKVRPESTHVSNWALKTFGVDYQQLISLYGI